MSSWKDRKKEHNKRYHAEWYQRNKDKVKRSSAATKARKEKWFRELKEQYSCERCGAYHPAIIEFHHKEPSQKDFAIGNFQDRSKAKILAEIKKCTPLCRNCHAIVHWEIRQDGELNGDN